MRVTLFLTSLVFFLLMLVVCQVVLFKVDQPFGVTPMVILALMIPVSAFLEALGIFAGAARWFGSNR